MFVSVLTIVEILPPLQVSTHDITRVEPIATTKREYMQYSITSSYMEYFLLL